MLSSLGHWVSCCWGYGRRSNGEAELLTAQDIGKHSYGEFSMPSIEANQQNEDSFHIESCPPLHYQPLIKSFNRFGLDKDEPVKPKLNRCRFIVIAFFLTKGLPKSSL